MKTISFILLLAISPFAGMSQTKPRSGDAIFVGNYIGNYVWEPLTTEIVLKPNHRFVLKKYNGWSTNVVEKTRGRWRVTAGKTLVLTARKGRNAEIVLERQGNTWYIRDKREYTFRAQFMHNTDLKTFFGTKEGC